MSKKTTAKKGPKCRRDIVDAILHYGGFKDALDYITFMLESRTSTSIIISGDVGIGKTSLIREAIKQCDVICIWLRPYVYTDDFTALRHVATELKLNPRLSLAEILEDLEERCLETDKKIVIVLPQFEEFCRKRQSLLYNLTHLTQHGDNMSLVGLSGSLDCTEHLEKRVRSRLNASFYHLKAPYSDFKQYVEFASLLLGGLKIDSNVQEQMRKMYTDGQWSIRSLKRLLILSIDWKDGKLIFKKTLEGRGQDFMELLGQRISWLTSPQLEILKMIMHYCHTHDTDDFTLSQLDEAARKNFDNFDAISRLAIGNVAFLVRSSFLRHAKFHKPIDRNSVLTLNILPIHFKTAMMMHPELHSSKTDNLWMKLS